MPSSGDDDGDRSELAGASPDDITVDALVREVERGAANHRTVIATTEAVVEDDPERVDELIDRAAPLLNHSDGTVRTAAAHMADVIATHRPERMEPLVPALVDSLATEYQSLFPSMRAIYRISAAAPEVLAPSASDLGHFLEHESPDVRASALDIINELATEHSEACTPLLPELLVTVDDPYKEQQTLTRAEVQGLDIEKGIASDPALREALVEEGGNVSDTESLYQQVQRKAAAVFVKIATAQPEAIEDDVPALTAIISDSTEVSAREAALKSLCALAEARPEAPAETTDTAVAVLVNEEDVRLRALASRLLGLIAEERPEAVSNSVEHAVPHVIDLLDEEDSFVRGSAAGLLSYVAEFYPRSIAPATDTLIDLLGEDERSVQVCALWTLGYVGGEEVIDELERVAETHPDADVQRAATEAKRIATE